jgi:hypothetical protein
MKNLSDTLGHSLNTSQKRRPLNQRARLQVSSHPAYQFTTVLLCVKGVAFAALFKGPLLTIQQTERVAYKRNRSKYISDAFSCTLLDS